MILEIIKKITSKIVAGIVKITVLSIILACTADAADNGVDDINIRDPLPMPGILESEATHFEIKNSSYLNVTLDSSEPIILTLESVPEMVTLHIDSASGAVSANIILSGFLPNTTYHKYEDDYHNHTTFTTNVDGSYAYTQDLSNKHLIFIQPRPSTRFINDNSTGGDCFLIGTWYAATKTCTLTTDLNETIQIDSDFITMNGNGHTITGSNTGYGIYLSGRRGITINNMNVNNFSIGIFIFYSSNNTLIGINASNNSLSGFHLFYSTRNLLKLNKALNSSYGIYMYISSNNTLIENNVSNNRNGIYMRSSSDGMLSSNRALNNNETGIYLLDSSNNILIGNEAQKNFYGIYLNSSSNNTLKGNNALNNYEIGIDLVYYSNNSLLSGNNVSNNRGIGIFLLESSNNTLNINNANNSTYGIALRFSTRNTLYGNFAYNNRAGINIDSSSNNNLTGNIMSDNFHNFDLNGVRTENLNQNIDTSNKVDGKPIYYIKNAVNQVYDSSTNAGTFYCISCYNVTIQDLVLANNGYGVYLWQTQNSRIRNVSASSTSCGIQGKWFSDNNTFIGNNDSNNDDGICLENSRNNMLSGNNALNNSLDGISLVYFCDNNTLSGNNVSNNRYSGISLLLFSYNNILSGNNISNNKYYGIDLYSTGSNKIYNNIFNNTINVKLYGSNIWNIIRKSGNNIIGGPYIGGNFWAKPDGKGFSQTCADADRDGICDTNYTLDAGNIDHLPLVMPQNLAPVADCGPDKLRCENVGSPVRFNGSASYDIDGSIVSYDWEFGDGFSYKGMDYAPAHTYSIYKWNGTAYQPFNVNLTVTDNDGLTNTTSKKVIIWIAGDSNGDGKVNILDASLVGLRWGGSEPCADLNNDGKVNILDASIIGLNWGKTA